MADKKSKTFVHKDTGHEATTTLPVEQNRLRAQGYREKDAKKVAPAPKPETSSK